MTRTVMTTCLVAMLGFGVAVGADPAKAKKSSTTKSVRPDPAAREVERVLRSEIVSTVNRQTELAGILDRQPDLSPARWQAGFVRDGNTWTRFDDPSASFSAAPELLERYHARRSETPNTADGQLDLANWCHKQKLYDQERSHLYTVLDLAPDADNTETLGRLGFVRIGGRWLSREDQLEWRRINHETAASLKTWGRKLAGIAERLEGSSPAVRDSALRDLRSITDPSAIPAIELMLAGRSAEVALVAVAALGRMNAHEASIALAKQGVFSKWPKVREAAAQTLKSRKLEDFVPALLGILATPLTANVQIINYDVLSLPDGVWGHVGTMVYSYVVARETEDQFQIATFNTVNSMTDDLLAGEGVFRTNSTSAEFVLNPKEKFALQRGRNDAIRAGESQLETQNRIVAQVDERTKELNDRTVTVLAVISDRKPDPDPRQWWTWWSGVNDVTPLSPKRVVKVTETETIGNLSPIVLYGSCFVAGTQVWTETGLRPIESLQVGDRVFAKDVETGELALKPVVRTTVRPPKDLTTLRVGDETIVCTGGHRFWVSGEGWIRAREIEPHSLIHTATGNTPAWMVKQGESAETYNLVVADFHSYFVGQSALLCQDLLPPRATNKLVPGLDRTHAVGKSAK